jgi:hypothetical protein
LVGFTPGSSSGITTRIFAKGADATLGQNMVIENKPGAGTKFPLRRSHEQLRRVWDHARVIALVQSHLPSHLPRMGRRRVDAWCKSARCQNDNAGA